MMLLTMAIVSWKVHRIAGSPNQQRNGEVRRPRHSDEYGGMVNFLTIEKEKNALKKGHII